MSGAFEPAAWHRWSTVLRADAQAGSGQSKVGSPHVQPVHTVYGGAHLFRATTFSRLNSIAAQSLEAYAPTAAALVEAVGGRDQAGTWPTVFERVRAKLHGRSATEDFRIDFEDGYGVRADAEDAHCLGAATALAQAVAAGEAPARCGLRIKALGSGTWQRALGTLQLFCSTLAAKGGGATPEEFIVCLPKVEKVAQVACLAEACDAIERSCEWAPGRLRLEIMVESPLALCDRGGANPLGSFIAAAQGRCVGVHLGAYDYLASCQVVATQAGLRHPWCDVARATMALAAGPASVPVVDGATQTLPLVPHKGPGELTSHQQQANAHAVHAAWRLHYDNVRHALTQGIYQGWDLHPAQYIPRYAAVFGFFLEHLPSVARRFLAFERSAAQASCVGTAFDDAASARGLRQYLQQGLRCGALLPDDLHALGVDAAALKGS